MSKILICSILFLFSLAARAQLGAVTTAAAGAGRATTESSETPVQNPAEIPFAKGYFLTTNYSFLQYGAGLNVGLTDNMPDTLVPSSLVYQQVNGKDRQQQDYQTQRGQLQVANFLKRRFSLGLGVRYEIDQLSLSRYTQANVLTGILWAFNDNLSTAITAENFIQPDSNVPSVYRMMPAVSLGVNYIYRQMLRFKADITTSSNNSWNGLTAAAGMESHLNKWLIFRLGANRNFETLADAYAGGIGFIGPKFAFNYAYISSPENLALARHAVDLAVPIW